MTYENNDRKFVAVINRKHALSVVLNGLAHAAFGLSGQGAHVGRLLDYPNHATGFLARVDESPFIILEAKNSDQLQMLAMAAMDRARLGACRALVVESENWPQRGQFLPNLQAHSSAMGQKGGKKWTAAVNLQPTTPKSDRLLAYNVFTTSMIGRSADSQIASTRDAMRDELDFVVVVLFGLRENVEPLTKRFSLFKA